MEEQIVLIEGKKYRKVWLFGGQDFGSDYETVTEDEEEKFYCEDCEEEYSKEKYENEFKICTDCEISKCPDCYERGKKCNVCDDFYCEECCAPQKQVMIEFDFPKKDKIRNICYYCVVTAVRTEYVDGKYIKKQKIETENV